MQKISNYRLINVGKFFQFFAAIVELVPIKNTILPLLEDVDKKCLLLDVKHGVCGWRTWRGALEFSDKVITCFP